MKYRNGDDIKNGDVIRWNCFDTDDFVNWTFTGLVSGDNVVYLGGGIDFGSAIGKTITLSDVEKESQDNDECFTGIVRVCSSYELSQAIAAINPAAKPSP